MIMATKAIKSFDSALDFNPATKPERTQSAWSSIVIGFDAIREGIRLAGEYKALTNRGVASEVAARRVFNKIDRDAA
jgi:hypothetical protein